MALLEPENARKLFVPKRSTYTKVSDNAPVKYDLDSKVSNSLIADGCIIEGEVENSVLFRGVKVGKGAKVRTVSLCRALLLVTMLSLTILSQTRTFLSVKTISLQARHSILCM